MYIPQLNRLSAIANNYQPPTPQEKYVMCIDLANLETKVTVRFFFQNPTSKMEHMLGIIFSGSCFFRFFFAEKKNRPPKSWNP